MLSNRREFLAAFGASAVGSLWRPATLYAQLKDDAVPRARGLSPAGTVDVARDEDFWRQIQDAYAIDRGMMNLNNGGVCPSPRVVQDALRRMTEFTNNAPAYTLWQVLEPEVENVRKRLARAFGCDAEELAITRNASEALETALLGLRLQPGDEVLTTTQDYPRMLTTLEQRVRRDGIVLKKIAFPTPPPGLEDLERRFAEAVTPRTRALLLCHITNLTGQIFPVRAICRMARERGIETVVDGAHAFAHFPFTRDQLDCDYYGTSLHKWLCAPIGTGFLYVRKEKIAKLWPLMAAPESMDENVRKFEEIGTHSAACHNAIAEALAFHEGIGAERKIARLRYLRDRWMRRLEGLKGVTLRTSFDPAMSGAIGNIDIAGVKPEALSSHLWARHRILVTPIGHEDCPGIRVTPNVYTMPSEIDEFATVLEGVAKNGLPA